MKRCLFAVLLCISTCHSVLACDACGGAGGGQSLGILPQFYRHFIGVQYNYNTFNSLHPSAYSNKPAERSQEYYNTIQAWGRYYLGCRYQLFAFVPYRVNVQRKPGSAITTSGIGDISLLANMVVLKADSAHKKLKQTLLAGGGIKLPTGKYTGISTLDRQGLPNMQAGTGSFDFVVNANYTLRYKMAGINADAAYTLTTANKERYKYGNKLNSGLLAFYWLQAGSFSVLPQAGVRYEYTLHDYDNYDRKWLNEQTGGYQCFAALGVQVYYKKLGFQAMYNKPVSQAYSAGNVVARQRIETGLFFLF